MSPRPQEEIDSEAIMSRVSRTTDADIDYTRRDCVEKMLSTYPMCEEDDHCMKLSDLRALRQLPGNEECVDCSRADPEWASISLGVFVCLECSGKHRSLGTHVSKIRSVRMDSWTDEQLNVMRLGGNQQCRDFLKEHFAKPLKGEEDGSQETVHLTIAQKYDSATAMWYQGILKARLHGTPEPAERPVYTPLRRKTLTIEGLASANKKRISGQWKFHSLGVDSAVSATRCSDEEGNKATENGFVALFSRLSMGFSQHKSTTEDFESKSEELSLGLKDDSSDTTSPCSNGSSVGGEVADDDISIKPSESEQGTIS